jgi:hypothetical protein
LFPVSRQFLPVAQTTSRIKAGIEPTLSFELVESKSTTFGAPHGVLIVRNNERGFRCCDLKALSSIADSTKKGKSGYIGHKGIGFKSVFAISDSPHVFSRKAKFFFSNSFKSGDLDFGYVAPQVIQDEQLTSWILQDESLHNWTTFVLPLRNEEVFPMLKEGLDKFTAHIMFFLKKLRKISIRCGSDAEWRHLTFKPTKVVHLPVPSLNSTIETTVAYVSTAEAEPTKWTFVRRQVSMAGVKEEAREGDAFKNYQPEITVAFPLETKVQELTRKNGTLYAFLPVNRTANLPFIVNSDFILTASRDDIQPNRAWNKRLLRESGLLAADGLEAILALTAKSDPSKLVDCLSLIPILSLDKFNDYMGATLVAELIDALHKRCILPADAPRVAGKLPSNIGLFKPSDLHQAPIVMNDAIFEYSAESELFQKASVISPKEWSSSLVSMSLFRADRMSSLLSQFGVRTYPNAGFIRVLASAEGHAWASERMACSKSGNQWIVDILDVLRRNGPPSRDARSFARFTLTGRDLTADYPVFLNCPARIPEAVVLPEICRVIDPSLATLVQAKRKLFDWLSEGEIVLKNLDPFELAQNLHSYLRTNVPESKKAVCSKFVLEELLGRESKKATEMISKTMVLVRGGTSMALLEATINPKEFAKLRPLFSDDDVFMKQTRNRTFDNEAYKFSQENLDRIYDLVPSKGVPSPMLSNAKVMLPSALQMMAQGMPHSINMPILRLPSHMPSLSSQRPKLCPRRLFGAPLWRCSCKRISIVAEKI